MLYILFTVATYHIAENVDGRKHWQTKLFKLFGVENCGKYLTKIWMLSIP